MDFSGIFNWLAGLIEAIGAFFKRIADWLMRHIIRHIIAFVTAAYEILDNIVQVIIGALKRIRKWYFDHVYKIQKKILDVISAVRVALSLLRLLGVKWAAKLDAELQKIQAVVTASILDVVRTLNTAMSYLGLIVDPLMVIRKDFFAASLFSSLAGVKRAAFFGSNTPLSASQQDAEAGDKQLLNPATPFAVANPDGTLTTSPAFDSMKKDFNAVAPDYFAR